MLQLLHSLACRKIKNYCRNNVRVSEVLLRAVSCFLSSDDVNPSDLSSLSDSLTLDDGQCSDAVVCLSSTPPT